MLMNFGMMTLMIYHLLADQERPLFAQKCVVEVYHLLMVSLKEINKTIFRQVISFISCLKKQEMEGVKIFDFLKFCGILILIK